MQIVKVRVSQQRTEDGLLPHVSYRVWYRICRRGVVLNSTLECLMTASLIHTITIRTMLRVWLMDRHDATRLNSGSLIRDVLF